LHSLAEAELRRRGSPLDAIMENNVERAGTSFGALEAHRRRQHPQAQWFGFMEY